MRFVGVDLAWSEHNPSGAAVIEADGTLSRAASDLRSNHEICKYAGLSEQEDAVVAIDAPLIVRNTNGQRPVERQLTKIFGPFDAGPHSASLKNALFQKTGRIQQFVQILEGLGFEHRPRIRKQQSQRVFLEVFPNPAQVILFPGITHSDHCHYRAPRFKYKQGRSWIETQCEWEIYRARLLSLRAKKPPITFSPEVKKSLGVDIEDYQGTQYKALDDLLDGVFCAYLGYYFWYQGDEHCWVVGNMETGYVTLPLCRMHNCPLTAGIRL